jgi:hypothetical protein
MINLTPIVKYFTFSNAPKREKILMAILLMGIPIMIFMFPVYLLKINQKPKPQPAILGGLAKIPHKHYKVKNKFFNTPYSGDTACFELINDSTIALKCICSCDSFKRNVKNNLELLNK